MLLENEYKVYGYKEKINKENVLLHIKILIIIYRRTVTLSGSRTIEKLLVELLVDYHDNHADSKMVSFIYRDS